MAGRRTSHLFAASMLVALLLPGATIAQAPPPPAAMKITLLGTAGGPPPHLDQSQPAGLIQIGGKAYLIDAGENVGQQALRAGVPPSRIDMAFITHLHWDHTLGLGYLMASGWMMGRKAPMPIWGPPGIAKYVRLEQAALGVGEDIFRPETPVSVPLASLYPVHETAIDRATEIYHDDTVRVTAAITTHFALNDAVHDYGRDLAYAYRFDTKAGSVTFTGDTGPSKAISDLARGSDILVSEICDIDSIRRAMLAAMGPGAKLDSVMAHMEKEHLSAEEVGKLATAAGVKTVVLTHYVMGRGVTPEQLAAKVRQTFKGEVVAGHDLQTLELPTR